MKPKHPGGQTPLPPALAARYDVLGVVGAGGYGTVYRARDRELDREVALKVLRQTEDQRAVERFRREAALLAELRHPGVVEVFDFGAEDGVPFLIMELLPGATLATRTPPDPLAVMLEVGEALEVLHGKGIIHRDLKPSNILWSEERGAVLIDFGLVSDLRRTRLTQTGAIVGTPAFLPPEQLRGDGAGPAGDWYAWGAILHFLLEGVPPHAPVELVEIASGEPPPPLRLAELDPASREARLLRRVLAEARAERPSSVKEIRRILAEGDRRRRRRSAGTSGRSPAPAGGGRRPGATGVVVAVVLAAALGWWVVPSAGPPDGAGTSPLVSHSDRSPAEDPVAPGPRDLRAAVARAFERAFGSHPHSEEGARGTMDDHIHVVLGEYADPAGAGPLREFLVALARWIVEGPPAEVDEWVRTRGEPALDHLAMDYIAAKIYVMYPKAWRRTTTGGGARDRPVPDRIREGVEVRAALAREVVGRLGPPGASPAARILSLRVRDFLSPAEQAAAVDAYLPEAAATRGATARARLLAALQTLAASDDASPETYPCRVRNGLSDATGRLLGDEAGQLPPRRRTVLACQFMMSQFLLLSSCRREISAEDLGRLRLAIDLAEAGTDVAPAEVALAVESLLQVHRLGSWLITSFGAGFDAEMERLLPLLRRARRALGAPADEPAFRDVTGTGFEILGDG